MISGQTQGYSLNFAEFGLSIWLSISLTLSDDSTAVTSVEVSFYY